MEPFNKGVNHHQMSTEWDKCQDSASHSFPHKGKMNVDGARAFSKYRVFRLSDACHIVLVHEGRCTSRFMEILENFAEI